MKRLLCILLLLSLCSAFLLSASEEALNRDSITDVLAYIEAEHPASLALGQTQMSLKDLRRVKDALPDNADFSFSFCLAQMWIDSSQTYIDLDQKTGKVTGHDLEDILYLMPWVKRIDVFRHGNLDNKTMMPIVDAHPDVFFGWIVKFGRDGKRYSIRSDATAFSTLKGHYKPMFTSKELEVLKYVPGLKAIDVGHNKVTSLEWLLNFPDLRILIVADNRVSDLTPLSQLKNLEYAELFLNVISDVTPLAGLTKLIDLNLCHNSITDISALDGLSNLERFFCSYNPLKEGESARFEALHPGCKTNWLVYSSVSAHWREHWRYDQFKEMFKTRVWHEFKAPEN